MLILLFDDMLIFFSIKLNNNIQFNKIKINISSIENVKGE